MKIRERERPCGPSSNVPRADHSRSVLADPLASLSRLSYFNSNVTVTDAVTEMRPGSITPSPAGERSPPAFWDTF
jgi:hypothetical protein